MFKLKNPFASKPKKITMSTAESIDRLWNKLCSAASKTNNDTVSILPLRNDMTSNDIICMLHIKDGAGKFETQYVTISQLISHLTTKIASGNESAI